MDEFSRRGTAAGRPRAGHRRGGHSRGRREDRSPNYNSNERNVARGSGGERRGRSPHERRGSARRRPRSRSYSSPRIHPTPPVPTLEDEELRGVEGLAREGVGEDPAVRRRRHLAAAVETTAADGHAISTTRITITTADPIMARSESGGTKEPSTIRLWMAVGAVGVLVRENMSRSTCPKLLRTRRRSHKGSPLAENATGMVGGGARRGGVLADGEALPPPHHPPPRHRRRRRGVPVDPKPVLEDAPPESSATTKPLTVVVGPAKQTESRQPRQQQQQPELPMKCYCQSRRRRRHGRLPTRPANHKRAAAAAAALFATSSGRYRGTF